MPDDYDKRLAIGQQSVEDYKSTSSNVTENRDGEQKLGSKETDTRIYKPYSSLSAKTLRELIMSAVWVEACVNTIVDEVVKYDLTVDNDNINISSFLAYPSGKEPLIAIRKQYLSDMLRYGNGCAIIEYIKNKPYTMCAGTGYSLRVTDKNSYKFVDVTKSGETYISSPVDKSKDLELTLKECMHFCLNKMSDATLGYSPVETVYNLMQCDVNFTKFLYSFSSRGLYKPFFMSGKEVKPSEMTELLELVENGLEDAGRSFGANKDIIIKDIPMVAPEEVLKMLESIGKLVCTAYKVPPFMINIGDSAGTSSREQYSRFVENVVKPIVKYESYIYTMNLVRSGFKDKTATITASGLTSRMSLDAARIATMLVNSGVMTTDEVRREFYGLDPLPKNQDQNA